LEEVRQGCSLPLIPFNSYNEYLTKEALEGFGDFKIEVICTVRYTNNHVLLVKEGTILQGMIDNITEILRCYGM